MCFYKYPWTAAERQTQNKMCPIVIKKVQIYWVMLSSYIAMLIPQVARHTYVGLANMNSTSEN